MVRPRSPRLTRLSRPIGSSSCLLGAIPRQTTPILKRVSRKKYVSTRIFGSSKLKNAVVEISSTTLCGSTSIVVDFDPSRLRVLLDAGVSSFSAGRARTAVFIVPIDGLMLRLQPCRVHLPNGQHVPGGG